MPPLAAACCRLFCSPLLLQRPRMMWELASPILEPTGVFDEMAAPLLMVAQLLIVSNYESCYGSD